MWQKPLIIFFLFYFFVLLQNSFFAYFNLFGAVPNLVFILFFLLVFFNRKSDNYYIIFLAAIAGFFLDIFSGKYLGMSIIALIIIGFLLKKTQSLLKNREDNYPFIYFLPLFIFSLLAYHLLSDYRFILNFGTEIIYSSIYNTLIASLFFYIFKKWQKYTK